MGREQHSQDAPDCREQSPVHRLFQQIASIEGVTMFPMKMRDAVSLEPIAVVRHVMYK